MELGSIGGTPQEGIPASTREGPKGSIMSRTRVIAKKNWVRRGGGVQVRWMLERQRQNLEDEKFGGKRAEKGDACSPPMVPNKKFGKRKSLGGAKSREDAQTILRR